MSVLGVERMLPKLKILRKEKEISQQKLADAIGMSQQSINQYENHDTEPDIQTLCRLADYFMTSVDYIVGHTDIKDPFDTTAAYHLNADEGGLITKYRALSPNERACVAQVIDTLLDK